MTDTNAGSSGSLTGHHWQAVAAVVASLIAAAALLAVTVMNLNANRDQKQSAKALADREAQVQDLQRQLEEARGGAGRAPKHREPSGRPASHIGEAPALLPTMFEHIDKAPPLERDKVARGFHGLPIYFSGVVTSISRTGPDNASVTIDHDYPAYWAYAEGLSAADAAVIRLNEGDRVSAYGPIARLETIKLGAVPQRYVTIDPATISVER